MHPTYDLIVIGGGSGGVACARRSAALGAKVALVERSRLGGTCVMRGCVPKKLMMYAGRIGAELRDAGAYGWNVANADFDLATWQQNKARELDRLEDIYQGMLEKSGVTILRGDATCMDAGSIKVDGQEISGKRILIATGGRPAAHAIPGLKDALTSDELLDLSVLPARMGVIGAGYIGLEFACIMANLGVAVTVFYRDPLPLRGFDRSVRERMVAALELLNIRLMPQSQFERVEQNDRLTVLHANGHSHSFDVLLNATGREPNTHDLGLQQIGIALAADGSIPVDAYSRTSVPGVFAIGDVTNRKNLTPVAIAEGRALAENEFNGGDIRIDYASVATASFVHPPIGSVGLTEEAALAKGRLRIYETEFRPMRTAFAGSQQKAFMKVIVEDSTDLVLGMHMLGDDAPEIIQALAVAYRMGAKKADLDRTIAVHPTIAEEFMLLREVSRVVG